MKKIGITYGLKFYVTHLYPKNADIRGGEVFKPFHKKDFKEIVQNIVDESTAVFEKTIERFPLRNN